MKCKLINIIKIQYKMSDDDEYEVTRILKKPESNPVEASKEVSLRFTTSPNLPK